MSYLVAMTLVRGKVIGVDTMNSKLIVYVTETDADVDSIWPDSLYVEAGSVINLYDDGAL